MLVAYGPDNRPIIAEETPLEQLHRWSYDRQLHCPNCRGTVHVRGGPGKRMQLHFAHQRGECAWSTETESVRHAQGKLVLAQWLREQFPQATVTLEERLPEPNRIADIFVVHSDKRCWAIEFQCAPLDIEEWRMRHEAYRNAGIIDTWIIGNNRREKQEAFIDAILATNHEVMFLDPQVRPPRIWLRWSITRAIAQEWQNNLLVTSQHPHTTTLDGRTDHTGYRAMLMGLLHEVHLNEQARLIHPTRTKIEKRFQLLQTMQSTTLPDEKTLFEFMHNEVGEEALRVVLIPLMRAYVRDPHLLQRYNYGRGQPDQPLSEADIQRVEKARSWLAALALRGFTTARLRELVKTIPFVGPYAPFANYAEMLIAHLSL